MLASTLRPLRRAVADVERLAADLEDATSAAAYDVALELALAHDAWDADRRAEVAAEQLGVGHLDPARLVGTLSGGQRTRLALATIMTTRPTCLLLDEPTNHLDDAALEVLGDFLAGLPGVVLLASHDRVFLDDVATDLVDLDPSAFGTDGEGGRRFGGGWTAYQEHRRRARERWEATYAQQQEELRALRAATVIGTDAIAHNRGPRDNDKFIHAFKGAGVERAHARRKRDAEQRLETAQAQQVRKPRPVLTFDAPLTSGAATGRVVLVRDLEVSGRLRLDRLDVTAGEHLLVSGGNGTGKSTLLGVLAGRLAPDAGEVQVAARRVCELAQDVRFADPRRAAAHGVRRPDPADGTRPARPRAAAPARPAHTGGPALGRPAPAPGPGDRHRVRSRPAAARRAHQPPLVGPRGGAGGGDRGQRGDDRRGDPRPVAAAPVGRGRGAALTFTQPSRLLHRAHGRRWQHGGDKGGTMYLLKVTSALGLLAGWLCLGNGIWFADYDEVAGGNLEAGGRFAMNFSIVLPYLGLSVIIALVFVLSLGSRPRTALPVLLALAVAFGFSIHVLGSDEYFAAFPDLETRTVMAMMILVASTALALLAVLVGTRVDESVAPPER